MLKIYIFLIVLVPSFVYSKSIFNDENSLLAGIIQHSDVNSFAIDILYNNKLRENFFYEHSIIQRTQQFQGSYGSSHTGLSFGYNINFGAFKDFDKFLLRFFIGSSLQLGIIRKITLSYTYQTGVDIIDYKGVGLRFMVGKEHSFTKNNRKTKNFFSYNLIYTF